MPDYIALKNSLTTTYANLSDAQIVTTCNTPNINISVDIQMSDVLMYFGVRGMLPTIKNWATTAPSNTTPEAVAAAQSFGLIIGPPAMFDTLQMSNTQVNMSITGMIDALVGANLITSNIATDILNMSVVTTSQASLWGWTNGITENDIVAARLM